MYITATAQTLSTAELLSWQQFIANHPPQQPSAKAALPRVGR
jgi:hypothetical protein